MRLRTICFSLLLLLFNSDDLSAQSLKRADYSSTPLSAALESMAREDGVRNGALIGAILGGAGAFTFGMWLCNNISEEGDPPCWKGSLVLGAIGAGGGALLGAGVDALAARRPAVRFTVRF